MELSWVCVEFVFEFVLSLCLSLCWVWVCVWVCVWVIADIVPGPPPRGGNRYDIPNNCSHFFLSTLKTFDDMRMSRSDDFGVQVGRLWHPGRMTFWFLLSGKLTCHDDMASSVPIFLFQVTRLSVSQPLPQNHSEQQERHTRFICMSYYTLLYRRPMLTPTQSCHQKWWNKTSVVIMLSEEASRRHATSSRIAIFGN